MPDRRSYELAGWEEPEPIECERCGYELQPLEDRCPRCGWAPGDPAETAAEEELPPAPSYEELKAQQQRTEATWTRAVMFAALGVVIAAPAGYLVGQLAGEAGIAGAIVAALIGANVAALLSRPDPLLLAPVVGTTWATVYLGGAFLAVAALASPNRHRIQYTPDWGTLVVVALIGGTVASLGFAWYLTHRRQAS